jgi:DNA-binding HxlR family transcriptional regulator
MELESMFSEQKWNILRSLSIEKLSPMQLAQRLNTTTANISQQLRLLEAANLVKKEKIKNRDKGKPRTLFSLAEDYAYLIPAMDNFADKKLIKVTQHHRIILKIWFLERHDVQFLIEKIYWKIESLLDEVSLIAWDEFADQVIIVTNSEKIEKILDKDEELHTKVVHKDEFKKFLSQREKKHPSLFGFSIILDKEGLVSA